MDNLTKDNQDTVVSIEGDILRYTFGSVIDEELALRLKKICLRVVHNDIVSLVVIDMNNTQRFSVTARSIWAEFLQESKITKTAMFGGSRFIKTIASFVVKKANVKNLKVFNKEEDALVWLRSQ